MPDGTMAGGGTAGTGEHATGEMVATGEPAAGEVVAIGDPVLLLGYALAGVRVLAAGDDEQVRAVWAGLTPAVGLVLLTPSAAEALPRSLDAATGPMVVRLAGESREAGDPREAGEPREQAGGRE